MTSFAWDGPAVQRFGWTLVHFVWQGAAVGGLFSVAVAALRRCSANVRYAVACAAMVVLAAAPVVTFLALRAEETPRCIHRGLNGAGATQAVGESEGGSAIGAAGDGEVAGVARPAAVAEMEDPPWAWVEPALPWCVAVWLTGVVLLSVWYIAAWVRLQRLRTAGTGAVAADLQAALRRLGRRMGVRRPVRLIESVSVAAPMVIGWLRPVVLLPVSAATGLAPGQIEAILSHELAHIRRHDWLVNLLQTVVETLLFYHPAVWWLSRRMRVEREHCCDDLAVGACGDRAGYARALTVLAERAVAPQAAVAATGGSLLERIRRILGLRADGDGPRRTYVAGAVVLAGLCTLAVVYSFLMGMAQAAPVRHAAGRSGPTDPATAAKVARRTEKLRKNVGQFSLMLTYRAPRGKYTRAAGLDMNSSLTLGGRTELGQRISRAEARRIIDHLRASGHLVRAQNVAWHAKIAYPPGPAVTLESHLPTGFWMLENLGWDRQMLKRLSALREVVGRDAVLAIDKLVKQVEAILAKWEKLPGDADVVLESAASKIRWRRHTGEGAMWQALAAIVQGGMTVRQMKIVLPPVTSAQGKIPAEVLLLDGAHFTISYALDSEFGLEASGVAKAKGPDGLVLAGPPRVRPLKALPIGSVELTARRKAAREIARKLKADLGSMEIHLSMTDPLRPKTKASDRCVLVLHAAAKPRPWGELAKRSTVWSARMTTRQAGDVIDYLASSGLLTATGPSDASEYGWLTIKAHDWRSTRGVFLGWGPALLAHLQSLRKALAMGGPAPRVMDELLKRARLVVKPALQGQLAQAPKTPHQQLADLKAADARSKTRSQSVQAKQLRGAGQGVATTSAWGKTVRDLRLRIETPKPRYTVGEEIVIGFTFENVSGKDMILLDAKYELRPWLHGFEFRDAAGKPIPYTSPVLDFTNARLIHQQLAPTRRVTHKVKLNSWKLAGLGHPYTEIGKEARTIVLRGGYHTLKGAKLPQGVWGGEVASDTIRIEIVSAQPETRQ